MKFIKVKMGTKVSEEVKKKLSKGELKFSHYSVSDDIGYLFYTEIK